MIQLSGAGKRYGPKILFENVDWLVTPNERVGIVGANGTGKSSLLKVLAGIEGLDSGIITTQKGVTIGYLPQDGLSLSGRTVFAECMTVFADLRALEEEQEQLTHRMAELDPGERRIRAGRRPVSHGRKRVPRPRRLRHRSAGGQRALRPRLSAARLEAPHRRVLRRLADAHRARQAAARKAQPAAARRAHQPPRPRSPQLAGGVSRRPIRTPSCWSRTTAISSTSRSARSPRCGTRGLHFYTGGYTRYEQQKNERRAQLEAAYENQRDRIEQLEAFINRFRYQATKAKQVQSRIKELEKIERIEIPPEEKTIHFSFPQPKPSGRIVAEFKGVAKSYGDHTRLLGRRLHHRARRPRRAGRRERRRQIDADQDAGRGGAGHRRRVHPRPQRAARLLRAGPVQGARPGRAHDRRPRRPSRRAPANTELRSILGCFLFSEDDVFKTIGVLSGGERNRYALARMLMQPSNFLLLDEPTNHLDMRAKDVLLTALQEFTGTVVFVSHDRYFIDKLATRVFEVEDGRVHVFPGNYEDYLWRKSGGGSMATGALDAVRAAAPAEPAAAEAKSAEKRVNPIKLRQMEERRSALEAEVGKAETEIAELEASLGKFVSVDETLRLDGLLRARRTSLEKLISEWEGVVEAIEANT